MRKRNRFSTRNIALCGLLTAMMLVLGFALLKACFPWPPPCRV